MAKSAAVLLGFVVLCAGLWWLALAGQREAAWAAPEDMRVPTLAAEPRPASAASASRERLAPVPESAATGLASAASSAVRGTVTDEEGRPVSGANVYATLSDRPVPAGRSRSAADGSFALERQGSGGEGQVVLHVTDQLGYEPLRSPPLSWGAADVRLVLRRGKTLEVEVVDAGDGAPVEPCDVELLTTGASGRFGQTAVVARPRPGVVLLAPVGAGRHVVLVVPKDGVHARVCPEVSLLALDAQREVVRVPRAQRRPLEVVDETRRGVPGTVFELVQLLDPRASRPFPGADPERARLGNSVQSVRMIAGATDAEGKSALIAAPGQRYALALMPPGRAQMVVREVLVDAALGPLVVTLVAGATLVGRIGPDEVIAQMWRSDAELATGRIFRPALWLVPLVPSAGGKVEGATADGQIPIARDGAFAFSGVAEGSFRVMMYWYDEKGTAHHEKLGAIEGLVAGERREVTFSLEHLRRIELSGRVLLDGAPFANQSLRLAGGGKDHNGEARACVPVEVKTDENGAFVAGIEPGTWHAELPVKANPGRPVWHKLWSDSLDVAPGRSARATFQAHPLKLAVTLLDSAGAPVAGQSVACRHERIGVVGCGRTDERGVAEAESLCPGKVELFWERSRSASGPAGVLVPLPPVAIGTLELRADRPVTAVTLSLPQ